MTPEQIATCTKLHLQGQSIYDIAPQVDRSPSAVAQTLRKPEIRALIEREANEILNRGLKSARRTITRLAAAGNRKNADKDTLKLALDASKHITGMAGLSGQAPSTIINQLIQVNQAPQQSRELDGLSAFLAQHWGVDKKDTGEVIDCVESIQMDMDRKYPEEKPAMGISAPHTGGANAAQERP